MSYTPRRGGETLYFYDDALLGIDRKITLRVPAFNPDRVFCFDGDEWICDALPERRFGVLEPAGAAEGNRRAKALRRKLADQGRNVARLSLEDETARHLAHMPDAPEAPVAAVVDAGMIDRLAARSQREAEELRAEEAARKARPQVEQFKPKRVAALRGFELLDDEEVGNV